MAATEGRFRRRVARVVVAGAVLVAAMGAMFAAPAAPANAYGSAAQFQVWLTSGPIVTNTNTTGDLCTVSASVRTQEFGANHVTGFKIKYELRSAYDPGYLITRDSTGYTNSNTFPNDARSFRWAMGLNPGTFVYGADRDFHLWVKVVADRGWRRDYTGHFDLGSVLCATEVDEDTGNEQPFSEGGF
ncbi:hypothetical protein [Naasia lichenicola]|uniref:DUF4352 domain-containing protein n=1 Tax=Naasia lichenicola TaxID=2565933 RepID=A0A4S4FTT1_9MICO|nr:hypothetical protein [Naasia lichenicola]THG33392.1 hypothetical protein E6C64_03325 [Naasia lichenicola]